MKRYTHAWLSLKALELLKTYHGHFDDERNKRLGRFIKFMSYYPRTFVRGAWFPDTIIKDNIQGGHTWKYSLDSINGRIVPYRPPSHNRCLRFVQSELGKRVSLNERTSDLPDRCEALSETIRDIIRMTNKIPSGDVLAFNNSQVAVMFLMLSHYVCDAHVPPHCDNRDFYTPSKIHPDLEGFWEHQIRKYYRVSTKTRQLILDENQNLQIDTTRRSFTNSILHKCDEILQASKWDNMNQAGQNWRDFLGNTNKNLWDYLVAVCLVSFHMSLKMFPLEPLAGVDYHAARIMRVSTLRDNVLQYSPYILADAIDSVALVWLATWERWELLAKGIR